MNSFKEKDKIRVCSDNKVLSYYNYRMTYKGLKGIVIKKLSEKESLKLFETHPLAYPKDKACYQVQFYDGKVYNITLVSESILEFDDYKTKKRCNEKECNNEGQKYFVGYLGEVLCQSCLSDSDINECHKCHSLMDNCSKVVTLINEEEDTQEEKYYCNHCSENEDIGECENCGDLYLNHLLLHDICYGCHPADCDECETDGYKKSIKRPFAFIPSETFKEFPSKSFVGVEIETHIIGSTKFITQKKQLHKYFNQVTDGSIDGMEFVSQPLQGDVLQKSITELCDDLKKRKYSVNKSCGLHIHIDARDYQEDIEVIKKIVLVYHKFENFIYDLLPPSRKADTTYCSSLRQLDPARIFSCRTLEAFKRFYYSTRNKESLLSKQKSKYAEKRYNGLNLHSIFFRGTLEVRYHSGTINAKKILNWIRLNLAMISYAKNNSLNDIFNLPNSLESFLDIFNSSGIKRYVLQRMNKFNPHKIPQMYAKKESNKGDDEYYQKEDKDEEIRERERDKAKEMMGE